MGTRLSRTLLELSTPTHLSLSERCRATTLNGEKVEHPSLDNEDICSIIHRLFIEMEMSVLAIGSNITGDIFNNMTIRHMSLVFFLTNGESESYTDVRRNSLEGAIKVCVEGHLQGMVSDAKATPRNLNAITRIKDSKLSPTSYGQLNNVAEVVYLQRIIGVEGVILESVKDITEAVSGIYGQKEEEEKEKE